MSIENPPLPPGSVPPAPPGFRSGFVALAGRANVGKSTLLNQLVGRKVSIVSSVPQTTRLVIRAVARTEGAEVVYVDTPGMHRPQHRMNREMVRLAREAFAGVDRIVLLVSGPEGIGPGDAYMFRLLKEVSVPALLAINKIDAMARTALLPLIDEVRHRGTWEEIVPLSALTGEGCPELAEALRRSLPEGPPMFPEDFITDLPLKLALGERIREAAFHRTRDEVPHSTAVLVDRVETTERGEYRVAATLYVDRDSQKGILIGEGGRMLKAIGVAARADLSSHLGVPVHLSLWVKVKPGWREDTPLLRLLGIVAPG